MEPSPHLSEGSRKIIRLIGSSRQTRYELPQRSNAAEWISLLQQGAFDMAKCEVCGNDYDKSMEIRLAGKSHTFDSFECAIHALAPQCHHCDCRIIGHGVEAGGRIFCCPNCARSSGTEEIRDRA